MLHVLLVILKVIGIVILAILLILLFLLSLVLFVPVRYQVYATKQSKLYAKVKATWLLHLIHIDIYMDQNGLIKSFQLFGVSIDQWKAFMDKFKKFFSTKKQKKINQAKKNSRNMTNMKAKKTDKGMETKPESKQSTQLSEQAEQKTENNRQASFKEENTENQEITLKEERKKKKKIRPIYQLTSWIKQLIRKIKKIFEKVITVLKNVKDKREIIKVFLRDEGNRQAFILGKEQLARLMKHIRPRKYKINLKFGTGDPALTGQILGLLGMLMPVYKDNAHIVPDFENVILEGDIFIKGRITLAKLLIIGWKLYRDKNIRKCYKMIMD